MFQAALLGPSSALPAHATLQQQRNGCAHAAADKASDKHCGSAASQQMGRAVHADERSAPAADVAAAVTAARQHDAGDARPDGIGGQRP